MLVVFDEHILIFSDKHCSFPKSEDLELDWKRWYKRAIEKSAKQAWGAERRLKAYPNDVYLDRACTQPFPLSIPSPEAAKYHLIVVAHGSEDRCKAELRGSGSLMLCSSPRPDEASVELPPTPFMVRDLDPNRTYVHVLTDSTLDILLQTLDTISDFVGYLDKKEKLFRSDTEVIVPGEEDLLAVFLMHTNADGVHDFSFANDYDGITLEEGFWQDFCQSPERIEQLKQNEISYHWDALIERFSHHALNATQYFTNHADLSNTEIGLRFMAREPRTVRRLIAKGLSDLYLSHTPDGMKRAKYLKPVSQGGAHYVFLCWPKPASLAYEDYRKARGGLLEAHCMVMKYEFPEARDIVGIASEPVRQDSGSSEDLLYLDAREWSDELNEEAARLQEDLDILTSVTPYHAHEREYPDPPGEKMGSVRRRVKVGPNERCPCGSGKKYKRCHGH